VSALVVFESIYGNTRAVAEAVAEGLGDAEARPVAEAAGLGSTPDLIVAGGPTHMHGLTTGLSRRMALQAAKEDGAATEDVDDATGLREWLRDLADGDGAPAAAFDTRIDRSPALTGSAARGIARRLRHRGYEVVETESFFVKDAEGPLEDGELERARAWGAALAARLPVGDAP
jgi:hypothetical protein